MHSEVQVRNGWKRVGVGRALVGEVLSNHASQAGIIVC